MPSPIMSLSCHWVKMYDYSSQSYLAYGYPRFSTVFTKTLGTSKTTANSIAARHLVPLLEIDTLHQTSPHWSLFVQNGYRRMLPKEL